MPEIYFLEDFKNQEKRMANQVFNAICPKNE